MLKYPQQSLFWLYHIKGKSVMKAWHALQLLGRTLGLQFFVWPRKSLPHRKHCACVRMCKAMWSSKIKTLSHIHKNYYIIPSKFSRYTVLYILHGAMFDWCRCLWGCALIRIVIPSPPCFVRVPLVLYRNVHSCVWMGSIWVVQYNNGK